MAKVSNCMFTSWTFITIEYNYSAFFLRPYSYKFYVRFTRSFKWKMVLLVLRFIDRYLTDSWQEMGRKTQIIADFLIWFEEMVFLVFGIVILKSNLGECFDVLDIKLSQLISFCYFINQTNWNDWNLIENVCVFYIANTEK